MKSALLQAFDNINVKDYVVEIPITGNYVSYRYSPNPFCASKQDARYNQNGVNCFYIAESVETAQHEVQFNFDNKELYTVNPGTIYAFDAQRFATEKSLMPMLTGSKSDGGYTFCQELALHLTTNHGLSGVFYPSRQMALQGQSGMCIALLPQAWQLESGKLTIFGKTA